MGLTRGGATLYWVLLLHILLSYWLEFPFLASSCHFIVISLHKNPVSVSALIATDDDIKLYVENSGKKNKTLAQYASYCKLSIR